MPIDKVGKVFSPTGMAGDKEIAGVLGISIIIANYNWGSNLRGCLESIFACGYHNLEVIFVDDASTDDSLAIAKGFPVRIIALKENRGPAYCRNLGAKQAAKEVLLFMDADVILNKDTLSLVANDFIHLGIDGIMGIAEKKPLNPGSLFSRYLALESHYIQRYTKDRYLSSFAAFFGAIKKDIFVRAGGFDEGYKGADIEDIEFGYRVPAGTKVYIDKNLYVKHHYSGFAAGLRKRFIRSLQWMQLKNKKADPTFFRPERFLASLLSFFCLFFLALLIVFPGLKGPVSIIIFVLLSAGAAAQRRFFSYLFRNAENPLAGGLFILLSYLFSLASFLGGVSGLACYLFHKGRQRRLLWNTE